MIDTPKFLAFDFGATSGRAIVGTLVDGKLELTEVHRFPNNILSLNGHLHWNIFSLYENMLAGLEKAKEQFGTITSIGIDTWGVDVAFVGKDGSMLGLPHSYRDPHTKGVPDLFFKQIMSREALYARTGIQVMDFNTLFQLFTLKRNGSSQLEAASNILFMPDALAYMLTGNMHTEYTIASTSHFLDPVAKKLDEELISSIGVDPSKFAEMVMPGTKVGEFRGIPVIAVAGHDTASAVAAVPAKDENYAYLSSGTWSLLGVVTQNPVLTTEAAAANITNEGGLNGSVRFLKNITGMWIVENLLSEWRVAGKSYSYTDLAPMALSVGEVPIRINPDDARFSAPSSMQEAIDDYCNATGQRSPESHSEYLRVVFESLAQRYGEMLDQICRISGKKVDTLHIIGGGSKNELLNSFTQKATGRKVVAGPSEATAIGNILVQARAAGINSVNY